MESATITTQATEDDLGSALHSALERATVEAEETLAARVAEGRLRRGARMNVNGEIILENPAKEPQVTRWPFRLVLRAGEGRAGREAMTVLAPDGRPVADVVRELLEARAADDGET